jgi:hypothetical protein
LATLTSVKLSLDAAHTHIDQVGFWIEMNFPHMFENLLA